MTEQQPNPRAATASAPGQYAVVNGLKMYYESHGVGEPLILLHGGAGGNEMFGPNLAALAATRRVIAVNLPGHGHTADREGPLRFEQMADDVAGLLALLLTQLGLPRADLLGYSLGGGVALQTAIRHPDLVRKLVVICEPFRRDGWYPEVLANMDQMGPAVGEAVSHSPLAALYPERDWVRLFTKLGDLLRQDYDWSAEVAALRLPVMLVFADADAVRLPHILEFYRLLGGGQHDAGLDGAARPAARLAILPGQTHYAILSSLAVTEELRPSWRRPCPTRGEARPWPPGQRRCYFSTRGRLARLERRQVVSWFVVDCDSDGKGGWTPAGKAPAKFDTREAAPAVELHQAASRPSRSRATGRVGWFNRG